MSTTQLLNSICTGAADSQQLFNSLRCIKPNHRPIGTLQLLQAVEEDERKQKLAAAAALNKHPPAPCCGRTRPPPGRRGTS